MKILIEESVLRQALEALEGINSICSDSRGVAGYHLNGDIAEWGEFDEMNQMDISITALRSALDAAEGVEPDYFGLTEDNTWMSCTKRIYDALKPEARMACYPAPHSNPQDEAERLDVNVRPTAWADLAVGTGGFLTTDEALSNGLTPLFDKAALDATFEDGRPAALSRGVLWNDGLAGYPREARQHVRKAYKMNQDCQVSREMPRYKCHKEVWALKIAEITFHEKDNGAHISPAEEGYGPFEVDEQFLVKHKPEVGGYYVVYADGYKSFSPAKAFEDGYSLV